MVNTSEGRPPLLQTQRKLFNAIAAAAIAGTALIASTTPASAQYYGNRTYTFQQRTNGFRVRDNYGNSSIFTNRGGGGYNFRNSNGGYGSIRFRNY
ncbi:hypothetical protein [Synechococcus sp. WH 7805]|uniref:hypothetical protein n=1 Tax=Synechococcus sp. (strain WH7805) TaxID=59931 RepID=UPI001E493AC5|nr:hypothetical protein [Synechococcus sp. WH 7805]